jgi:hypothetical protein
MMSTKYNLYESIFSEGITDSQIADQLKSRSSSEKLAGGYVKYDSKSPTLEVVRSDGEEYYFRDYEVDEMYEKFKEDSVSDLISFEDYVLALSQSW